MAPPSQPSAADLARYMEQRGELGKPWMLQMLRLAKLKEAKSSMSPEAYMKSLQDADADLRRMGEFGKGREAEGVTCGYVPSQMNEHRPGAAEDR